MEHQIRSPDLAPDDFWLFPKTKSVLKRRRFQDTEDIQKTRDNDTESYSTIGVPKSFSQVAASLSEVHSCSWGVFRR
jgi:hypothetical protein